MGDGLIILKSVEAAGEHKNLLRIEKMRSCKINKESHIYDFGKGGMELTRTSSR